MKKALIIHGWDGNPKEPLHNYLKRELETLGHEVTIPVMPNPAVPVISDWIEKIKSVFDKDFDLIIGHSIGCQGVLRFIENLESNIIISKVILIAPWMKLDMQTIEEEGEEVVEIAKPWMETPIDFDVVKKRVGKVITIFSDNDPYVPLDQADFFKDKLGAQVFIEKEQGHFTESDNFEKLQTETNLLLP
ncbi:MAG TPA: alpha/beta hydrolase [Candidatus Paceibacterota bacterium]|nr:alpha/beta hydrolase [Candidatus Paceibacterota bacterium]HRZ34683.1 alpha/beta hydrolase [Candidatus Paceibacterota bacterium]